MKLITAVLHLGEHRLVVVSEGRDGRRRRIKVDWLSKEKTNCPPVYWPESVEAEHDFQESEEDARKCGRALPWRK